MKAKYSSETSVDIQRATWRYIPEDVIVVIKYITEDATIIPTHDRVTVNEVWIDDLIYCKL
jgi:hypothetical protein